MHCCCGQCEISISDTYASREAFVKVRQFICVYWQTAWNVLVKNCKSLPFLYATFRPVNTSTWKWESCLCPESAHIALPVPPGGTPVVWPSSQLFVLRQPSQVIVPGHCFKEKYKKVESLVFFAWHVVQLEQLKSFANVFSGMNWPACLFSCYVSPSSAVY